MDNGGIWRRVGPFALALGLLLVGAAAAHQPRPDGAGEGMDRGTHRDEPHGTPEGWTFTLPRGEPARGRQVFVKYECYSCHEVEGERFPGRAEGDSVGPELASMAGHHPPEFFAESIVNPGAVIDRGMSYEAADGSSKMPSYNDLMTIQELVDLVAYLTALRPPAGGGGHAHPAGGAPGGLRP